MPKNIRADKIAKKQVDRATQTETEDYYKDAMGNLTVNPAAEAAKKEDEWFAELEAIYKAKLFSQIMGKIKKEDVTGPAVLFGGENLRKGVENRKAKIENFWAKWGPKLKAIMDEINKMEDKTDEQKEKKMIAMKNALKKAKGTWR